MAITLVEGWTERIQYRLTNDGTAVNITGATVQIVAFTKDSVEVKFQGTAGIVTAASGIVYFDPASNDLQSEQSPYSIRWKVTDVTGKVSFFPGGAFPSKPEKWHVERI